MQHFTRLKVWTKAHELALGVYRATTAFPGPERYGLAAQARRAATSVLGNIAEGRGRSRDGEFRRFLAIALGSATELECHLLLARDLSLLSARECEPLVLQSREVQRMLTSLLERLRADRPKLMAGG